MKWYDVSKKEPPFNERLLFSKGTGDWEDGYLKEIRSTKDGKEMTSASNGETTEGFIFWAKPEPPKQ